MKEGMKSECFVAKAMQVTIDRSERDCTYHFHRPDTVALLNVRVCSA
jgi:hypothetical protein